MILCYLNRLKEYAILIIRDKNNRFKLLFVWHGTVFPRVLPHILGMMILSLLIWLLYYFQLYHISRIPAVGLTIFGVIISLFLGFRNHACYDRWWEARKLWGALVANTRHLSRDSHFLAPNRREKLLLYMLVFVVLLRDRLRGQAIQTEQFSAYIQLEPDLLIQLHHEINPPQRILEQMQKQFISAIQDGQLSDIIYLSIQKHMIEMGNIQAGCDRILTTPLPFPYSVLLHRAVFCFCWLLPFAFVPIMGIWTSILVGFIAYFLLGLDELNHQLEEPFGTADHDLALDTMVRMIERETLTLLDKPIPDTLPTRDFIYH